MARGMGFRREQFAPGEVYHLLNRGVEGRTVFLDDADRVHFLHLLAYHLRPSPVPFSHRTRFSQSSAPHGRQSLGELLLELLCFALMPNHFHLLVRQAAEAGVSRYMQRVLNSYARYFNTRHRRSGPLFAGQYRAVHVGTDEQLVHVSRYIHLNPYVAGLTRHPLDAPWTSLPVYVDHPREPYPPLGPPVSTELVQSLIPRGEYARFLTDHAGYARALGHIKYLLLEEDPLALRQEVRVGRLRRSAL